MAATSEREIDTVHGPARLLTTRAARPRLDLVITHGAGGGVEARDLVALDEKLPALGFTVHRLVMPWRVAGKKIAPRPPILDECFVAALSAVSTRGRPLVIGGRSAGARSACRIAGEVAASGVLALAFPLHPPGRPERSRLDELEAASVPVLVVQGQRDPFGGPSEFPASTNLVEVPAADHGLKVPARAAIGQDQVLEDLTVAVAAWLTELAGN